MLDPITAAKLKSAHDAIGAAIGTDSDGPLSGRRTYLRGLIARSVEPNGVRDLIARRWPWADTAAIEKSAVGALAGVGDRSTSDFLAAIRQRTILGRAGFRQIPFRARVTAATQGAKGYWTAQGAAVPLSQATLSGITLQPLSVAAITASTGEALAHGSPLVENGLQIDLEAAIAEAIDWAAFDPANTGVPGEVPASLWNGVTPLPSSGDPEDDIAALVNAFTGRLDHAAVITSPTIAAQIAIRTRAQDLGPNGGRWLGLPVFTTHAMSADSLGGFVGMIDVTSALFALDDLQVSRTDEALLELDDDPQGSSTAPTAASENLVSLWQTNTIAWMARAAANWRLIGGAAAMVDGVNYAGEGSP